MTDKKKDLKKKQGNVKEMKKTGKPEKSMSMKKQPAKEENKKVVKKQETAEKLKMQRVIIEDEIPRFFECAECGLVVSIEEECDCNICDLLCCGVPMVEVVSMIGEVYHCKSCGLKVVVEDICDCDSPCDLVCCEHPMVLFEE